MHKEKNISLSLEYNTDALASTFTKLTNGISTFHGTQGNTVSSEVFITEKEFHKLIDYVFVPYRNKLVEDFIRMATKEFSGRCRKDVMGYEDLICHTVTSPIIRKGKITEQGMFTRRDMIFECNKKQGHVDFCILLLPFRTYSPIKNYGVMPDAGELYTVMVLSALAIACKQVQITIKEIASNIAESYVKLRVSVLANALHGAVEYCSAYEANTGSRNQEGFDDVKTLFPDALRMSIHRKDESLGQFSIFVSPSHERTPWHGTAVLRRKENHLSFDTELAVCISRLEYSPLLLNGRLNGATYQQPLMFIHHSLQKYFNGLTDEDSLLELNTLLHKGEC